MPVDQVETMVEKGRFPQEEFDEYLHYLLLSYDPDIKKIFKVRADFDTAMDKNEASIRQFAEFIKKTKDRRILRLLP
jgi:hypothetical protein